MSDENQEEEGVVHVDSGSFRVDRRRALDKLMRFQLPQAEMFMLPVVRCAIAGGATYVRLAQAQDALEIRFDGRPFDRKELLDPYSCLFDKHAPENRRNRELAIGLLTVLRLKPQFVTLVSGAAGNRHRLRVESAESDRVDPSEDPSPETVVKVVPGSETPALWVKERAEWVEQLCRVSPIPIWLNGQEASRVREPAHPPGIYFEGKEARGWVTVPAEPAAVSTLQTYTLGVFVAPTQATLARVQVEGYVNDDQFTLTASQTALARNLRFRRTMEIVGAKAEELLKLIAEQNKDRLEAVAKAAIYGEMLYYWRNRLERGSPAEKPSPLEGAKESVKGAFKLLAGVDLKKRQEEIDDVYWAARATAWLRDAAGRLLQDPDKDNKDPLLAALWSAPIQLGISGAALSLLDLEIQRRRLGYIPVSQKAAPGRTLPFEAVWVTSARDVEVLVRRFPDAIRDVTDHLEAISGAQSRPLAGRVSLEQAGIADVLVRDVFSGGDARGEIGLALVPHDKGARLTMLENGAAVQFTEVPSGLRFEAALEATGPGPSERLPELLTSSAGTLYPKLLGEYDCWKPGERMQAIRNHLLDYLAAERAGLELADKGAPSTSWIETVPLFDFVDSWLDFDRLRSAVGEGRPVYLAAERAAALQLPGKLVMAGRRFSDEFLARLLPGATVMDVPGREGLRVLVSSLSEFECAHAGAGCLLERTVDSAIVHLAVGPGPGQVLELPWGRVRALSPAPLSPSDATTLAEDYRLAMDAIYALLKRRGTGLGEAGEERAFLLDALGHVLAPWPGRGPARPRQNLIEFLDMMPLFRQPQGAGWTIGQVASRLGAALDVSYTDPSRAAQELSADLVLDAREIELLRAMFPGWQKRLIEWSAAPRPEPAAAPAPAPAAADPAEAAPSPAAEYSPPAYLTFEEPMLFSRVYSENGISARVGLPFKPAQSSLAVFRNGKSVDWPDAPQFVGAARVEIGGWKGRSAPQPEAVQALLHRFYLDLADHWPIADPSTPDHVAAVEQVVRFLILQRAKGAPKTKGAEPAERLRELKMFKTLAGGLSSVTEVAALAKEREALPYAEREFLPVPESAAPAPVLTPALAKLLGTLIDAKPKAVRPPAPPKPQPAPDPAPKTDGREEHEAIVRARHLLRHLRGRRGLKVRSASLLVAENADPSAPLVTLEPSGAWMLQPYHPAVIAVLNAGLSPEEQGAYLASMVYTAANRLLDDVTDFDDAKFQQALADFITAPGPTEEPAEEGEPAEDE